MAIRQTLIAVSGTVVVLERDHRERIRHLGLVVRNADTLVVDPTPMSELLLDFVGECVLARGTV